MTINRRQFTTTAAWSVPVIAVAAATPAAAASNAPAFNAHVEGFCLGTGVPGAVYASFRISSLTDTPIPAGQMITVTMNDAVNGGQLTEGSIYTATGGGTAGISNIEVSSDQTTWTAMTTREIASDSELNLYVSGVGFSTTGETATCSISSNDNDTADNSSTITRVSLNDGLCSVA